MRSIGAKTIGWFDLGSRREPDETAILDMRRGRALS